MKNTLVLFLSFCFFTVISANCAYSAESEKLDTVVVTGMGVNADKARQNAVRNAVEQVVGVYVKSDTLVVNSALIKDEVLSHSGGYVQSTKVISSEKTDDGLYLVKIEAKVVSTRLVKKLNDLNIATKKIDNAGLFQAALSDIDQTKSKSDEQITAIDMLRNVMNKYPHAAYNYKIGEPKILSTNSANSTANIELPVTIFWAANFVDELKSTLKKITSNNLEFVNIYDVQKNNNTSRYLCITKTKSRARKVWDYCAELNMVDSDLLRSEYVLRSIINSSDTVQKLAFKILFKSSTGETIYGYTYKYTMADKDTSQAIDKYSIGSTRTKNNPLIEYFVTGHGSIAIPISILTDLNYTFNIPINIDLDIIKSVDSIEISIYDENRNDPSIMKAVKPRRKGQKK